MALRFSSNNVEQHGSPGPGIRGAVPGSELPPRGDIPGYGEEVQRSRNSLRGEAANSSPSSPSLGQPVRPLSPVPSDEVYPAAPIGLWLQYPGWAALLLTPLGGLGMGLPLAEETGAKVSWRARA